MTVSVVATPLPVSSGLNDFMSNGDFLDCYAAPSTAELREAAETIVAFPAWANMLVKLRALVTRPFGLLQDGPDATDKIGPFPVVSETESEIIAGFDDKHLNFRISVLMDAGKLHLATWVRCHNIGRRIYLATIMPFHILIARNAVCRAIKSEGPLDS